MIAYAVDLLTPGVFVLALIIGHVFTSYVLLRMEQEQRGRPPRRARLCCLSFAGLAGLLLLWAGGCWLTGWFSV